MKVYAVYYHNLGEFNGNDCFVYLFKDKHSADVYADYRRKSNKTDGVYTVAPVEVYDIKQFGLE